MKKTLFAGLLLATFSTSLMNANSLKITDPTDAKAFHYTTSYSSEKVGNCTITYKITTKYLLCFVISCTKTQVSKTCTGTGTGPGDGGQNGLPN